MPIFKIPTSKHDDSPDSGPRSSRNTPVPHSGAELLNDREKARLLAIVPVFIAFSAGSFALYWIYAWVTRADNIRMLIGIHVTVAALLLIIGGILYRLIVQAKVRENSIAGLLYMTVLSIGICVSAYFSGDGAPLAMAYCALFVILTSTIWREVPHHIISFVTVMTPPFVLLAIEQGRDGNWPAYSALSASIFGAGALLAFKERQTLNHIDHLHAELETRAHYDSLTGLLNRQAWFDQVLPLHEATQQSDRTSVVLYLDIDDFKYVNDRFGHHVGDGVLCMLADCLRQVAIVRPGDRQSRLGGDEFVTFLPDTNLEQADVVCSAIHASFPSALSDTEHVVTVSIGVAQSRPGDSLEEVIRRADEDLLKVKVRHHGRVDASSEYTHSLSRLTPDEELHPPRPVRSGLMPIS